MKILTTTTATTIGGRDGHGTSADGNVDIQFALPKELGGAGKKGATPEHLFGLGYAACFGSAMQHVAGRSKKKLDPNFSVTAVVGLGARGDGGFALEVELKVKLPGVDAAEAQALAEEADKVCPYSHAIRGNVPVKISVI
ncbi:MAG TPA: Ohr family peroxiredoxin [Candidatus Methylacidiphilales bacterium]|nr:Ohr family peroxiredoxin [Candidatus Methylacidiphilales bacterium]